MTPPSPEFQRTARRLIESTSESSVDVVAITRGAEQVFRRLHDHLATLIGVVGFKTLLGRALKLARAELPALARLEVKDGGTIEGLPEALAELTPDEALATPTGLLAHFLDLLAAFVGEDFASHLVTEAVQRGMTDGTPNGREESATQRSPKDR